MKPVRRSAAVGLGRPRAVNGLAALSGGQKQRVALAQALISSSGPAVA